MNRFDWKWYLKDVKQDKPVKVFTTFSCGGVQVWVTSVRDSRSLGMLR